MVDLECLVQKPRKNECFCRLPGLTVQFPLVGAQGAAYYLKIGAAYLIAGMFHDR